VDLASLAKGPIALEAFVERIPLDAPEGEPLRLEFESFVAAVRGEPPVVVSGEDGREALAVALRIVKEIERTLPSLAGSSSAQTDGAANVGSVARA
jgi:predicted dehydrogenase